MFRELNPGYSINSNKNQYHLEGMFVLNRFTPMQIHIKKQNIKKLSNRRLRKRWIRDGSHSKISNLVSLNAPCCLEPPFLICLNAEKCVEESHDPGEVLKGMV